MRNLLLNNQEHEFQVGDLVSHNRIGTLGVITEIFSKGKENFAVVHYGAVMREEKIQDLLPSCLSLEEKNVG